jgi:hypothetical protein
MGRTRIFALALIYIAAFVVSLTSGFVSAQKKAEPQKTAAKPVSTLFTSANSPNNDPEFARKVKEYTTEPYFMTELVDHLPVSDKVPSPEKVLGYVVGTPNKLTYTKDLYRYYRELAKASPPCACSPHRKNPKKARSNC